MLKKQDQNTSRDEFLLKAQQIPTLPQDRIAEPLHSLVYNNNELLKEGNAFFDAHAHSFTMDHIPRDFIKLLNWVSNQDKAKILKWVDRKFGQLMGLDNPKKVIDNLVNIYDHNFKENKIAPALFIVNLSMDMERGISGAPTFNYKSQLEQLLQFRQKSHQGDHTKRTYNYQTTILPFLAIDPNNPDAFEYFLSAFIKDYNTTGISELDNAAPFIGMKLYPTLGYHPQDSTLQDIYAVCEAKSIPITTHCGGLRTRTNKRSVEVGVRRIKNGKIVDEKKVVKLQSKKHFKNVFLDPLHWDKMLQKFPKLKLNLAHFGDAEEWISFHKNPRDAKSHVFKSLKMIEKYDNVYADISYSYFDDDNRRVITGMMQMDKYKNRILNGSDFFLTEIEKYSTRQFLDKLQKAFKLDPDGYHLLTAVNPYRFLFEEAK